MAASPTTDGAAAGAAEAAAAAPAPAPSPAPPSSSSSTSAHGLDLSSLSHTLATAEGQIVLNRLANRSTPLLAAFGARRLLGEEALDQQIANAANTVTETFALLGVGAAAFAQARDPHAAAVAQAEAEGDDAAAADGSGDAARVLVELRGEQVALAGAQLLGMHFAELRGRLAHEGQDSTQATQRVGVAVKDHVAPAVAADIQAAARIGGLAAGVQLVRTTAALACVYGDRLRREAAAESTPRTVMFVDIGATATVASVVRFEAESWTELGFRAAAALGVRALDSRLYTHIAAQLAAKHGVEVAAGSRRGLRLLREVGKLRKILSANKAHQLLLECFADDKDFVFDVDRAVFESLCADDMAQLQALLGEVGGLNGWKLNFVTLLNFVEPC